MRVLGVVTARGGSKGIPNKNIRPLSGEPLLRYTAESALAATCLDRVVLSTDSALVAKVGRASGLCVPFLRPPELARDNTPSVPVLQHATAWFERQGLCFDAVCLLEPTAPFRRAEYIDDCVSLLETTGADSVMTVLPVPTKYNPHWVYFSNEVGELRVSTGEDERIPRRQDLPPAFHPDGSVYVVRRDVLMDAGTLYGKQIMGLALKHAECIDIDSPDDWKRAETLMHAIKRVPDYARPPTPSSVDGVKC